MKAKIGCALDWMMEHSLPIGLSLLAGIVGYEMALAASAVISRCSELVAR